MYKKIVAIVLIIFVIGISFYFFKKSDPITNHPSQGTTIVVFGDSLVAGLGATIGNDFPSILEGLVGENIINMGVSGHTSAQGLARVEEVNKEDPKVVMVLLGGNDFLRKVPIEETFKNIDAIVVSLQNQGAVVILLGVRGGLLADPYAERFESIAKERGALYVPDVLDGLIGNRDYMSDSIHPNDAGYEKIAKKIYPTLKKALE